MFQKVLHLHYPDFEVCLNAFHRQWLPTSARGPVSDDRTGCIANIELTRQRGFGHPGHADHVTAVALYAVDLRGGL